MLSHNYRSIEQIKQKIAAIDLCTTNCITSIIWKCSNDNRWSWSLIAFICVYLCTWLQPISTHLNPFPNTFTLYSYVFNWTNWEIWYSWSTYIKYVLMIEVQIDCSKQSVNDVCRIHLSIIIIIISSATSFQFRVVWHTEKCVLFTEHAPFNIVWHRFISTIIFWFRETIGRRLLNWFYI